MSDLRDRVFAATGLRSAAERLRREAADYRKDTVAGLQAVAYGDANTAKNEVLARSLDAIAAILDGQAEEMVRGIRKPGLDPYWLERVGINAEELLLWGDRCGICGRTRSAVEHGPPFGIDGKGAANGHHVFAPAPEIAPTPDGRDPR